ncbi:MAG: FAD-dependent oxidoreductase [Deltaproteobacteria bacterium]|nr:FAD-dependent oxidoreductase [Deltaproteobacteria bacterium]
MSATQPWNEESEVIVVGYGGAGACTAIAAHDAGARVLILEKQPADTPTRTRHTPSTRLSGGGWFWPENRQDVLTYLEALTTAASEPLTDERKEQLSVFADLLVGNMDWMDRIGFPVSGEESVSALWKDLPGAKVVGGRVYRAEYPELPGSSCCCNVSAPAVEKFKRGPAFFKHISEAVEKRGIPVLWETPAVRLITEQGEVRGVVANRAGKEIRIKARRAVVLTCGGFEYNDWMKENYLRTYPVYFTGNPANTGDGVNMALEAGAALWHMNKASWRTVLKFPELPCAFSTQHHTSSVFVDKRGKRFSSERYKGHSFGYELTNFDCSVNCYPKVPCYWIFDETRRLHSPLVLEAGACNPPGGVMGDIFYLWSQDNQAEIDRGWIMKADTLEELGAKILADPDNQGLMNPAVLAATVRQYNGYCETGEDLDFHKDKNSLQPLAKPPYYAVKLWPGGPNTQGGPKRNTKGQIVHPDNSPIPRLYSAGELGSFYGMLYPVGGGNLAECIAFGRISGANAAAEKLWD